MVPRLTPTSVRGLLKHLLYIRETWVKTHLSDDLNAITERAYHVWPTRLRTSFTVMKKNGVASAKRLKKSCNKPIQKCAHKGDTNLAGICEDEMSDEDMAVSGEEGVAVEGELFFDPLDPLNESDDESSIGAQQNAEREEKDNDWVPFDEPPMESDEDAQVSSKVPEDNTTESAEIDQQTSDQDGEEIEEMPLPRMFIPGKIVHIYTNRGGYKAGEFVG